VEKARGEESDKKKKKKEKREKREEKTTKRRDEGGLKKNLKKIFLTFQSYPRLLSQARIAFCLLASWPLPAAQFFFVRARCSRKKRTRASAFREKKKKNRRRRSSFDLLLRERERKESNSVIHIFPRVEFKRFKSLNVHSGLLARYDSLKLPRGKPRSTNETELRVTRKAAVITDRFGRDCHHETRIQRSSKARELGERKRRVEASGATSGRALENLCRVSQH